jgi:hypothetical protein
MINLHTARGTALGDILRAYRYGELSFAEEVELFQYLINAGIIVHLDGFYGRQVSRLIEAGHCKPLVEYEEDSK